jgi:hypothetical protein
MDINTYVDANYTYGSDNKVYFNGVPVKYYPFKNANGYRGYKVHIDLNKTTRYLHDIVWFLCNGQWPGYIEFIDGDCFNYHIDNLVDSGCQPINHNCAIEYFPVVVNTYVPAIDVHYTKKSSCSLFVYSEELDLADAIQRVDTLFPDFDEESRHAFIMMYMGVYCGKYVGIAEATRLWDAHYGSRVYDHYHRLKFDLRSAYGEEQVVAWLDAFMAGSGLVTVEVINKILVSYGKRPFDCRYTTAPPLKIDNELVVECTEPVVCDEWPPMGATLMLPIRVDVKNVKRYPYVCPDSMVVGQWRWKRIINKKHYSKNGFKTELDAHLHCVAFFAEILK